MSGSEDKRDAVAQPDVERVAETNPKVDITQIREAQALLAELKQQGLVRPEYEIASPYARPRRSRERQRLGSETANA
jgi:hypothetical protein